MVDFVTDIGDHLFLFKYLLSLLFFLLNRVKQSISQTEIDDENEQKKKNKTKKKKSSSKNTSQVYIDIFRLIFISYFSSFVYIIPHHSSSLY